MNEKKVRRPCVHANSYIEFLSFLRAGFDPPYRTVEGITEALSEFIAFIREMHFTRIRRRMLFLTRGISHPIS